MSCEGANSRGETMGYAFCVKFLVASLFICF